MLRPGVQRGERRSPPELDIRPFGRASLLALLSDLAYSIREFKKLRKFKRLIRSGVEKCEPRYREITDLAVEPVPGTVEFAHIARYRFAARFLRGGQVLNAACGSGYGNAILAMAGVAPIGVDLFEKPLAVARQHFPHGEYIRADVQDLGRFRDAIFDAVVSFETVEHVRDPIRGCSELKRVLRPGGVFVGSLPIMIFHNPGTNFTWAAVRAFVDREFPGATLYLQDNHAIEHFSAARWRAVRGQGDKYLLWVWHK